MWNKIQRIYIGTNQVRPPYKREPDATRTMLYLKFENNTNDSSGNNVSVSSAWVGYGTVGNLHYVERTWSASWTYIKPTQTLLQAIWTWDFAVSFRIYWVSKGSSPTWVFVNEYDSSSPRKWLYCYADGTNIGSAIDGNFSNLILTPYSLRTWTHYVSTRVSGVNYLYLNGELKWTNTNTQDLSNPWVNKFVILNRNDYTAQAWGEAWARMSEVICEKVWWSADQVSKYYNSTKDNFS